jgi:putative transposase
MGATIELVEQIGARAACAGLGVSRASLHRACQVCLPKHTALRARRSPLASSKAQRVVILALLHSSEYATSHSAPPMSCCSTPASFIRPESLATAPREVWSWKITKLKGPVKLTHFHLYLILDIFSRYVVG